MRGATGPTGDIPYVPKPRIDIRESPLPKVEIQQTLTTLIETWTAKIKGEGNTRIFFQPAPEIDMGEAAQHLKEAYQDIVNLTTEQTREALKLPAKKETPTSTRAKPSIPISVREAAKLLRLTRQTIQAVTILRSGKARARLKKTNILQHIKRIKDFRSFQRNQAQRHQKERQANQTGNSQCEKRISKNGG
jgi:hypothetical protein